MTTQIKKMAGRPRSLDLETLLDVAATMDLTTISMKSLADRLGVGVATVYRYIKDRESLVRLASARSVHVAIPDDHGQPWQDVVRGFAESTFGSLSVNPALLHAYLDGHLGSELEVEFADRFLAQMSRRGFADFHAMQIFRAAGLLAVGAAAATLHVRALTLMSDGFVATVDNALADRMSSELPDLRRALRSYKDIGGKPDLGPALDMLIAGINGPAA